MGRLPGSKDKKKRKRRKDAKHKRNKHGKLIKYKSKRGPDDPIKLFFWEIRDMKRSSLMNWGKRLRSRVSKRVFIPFKRVDVDPVDISTRENIKELALNVIGEEGTFRMRGFGHGKNTWGVKQVRLVDIYIKEKDGQLEVRLDDCWRLKRKYKWLWRDN